MRLAGALAVLTLAGREIAPFGPLLSCEVNLGLDEDKACRFL